MPLSAYAFSFDLFNEKFFNDLENINETVPAEINSGHAQIINKVSVSANTGGNTAASGETIEGKGKTEIVINSTINGKEIDPVEIRSEANEIKLESKIEADGEKALVQRETEIDSVKKTENYEVDLKNLELDGAEAGIFTASVLAQSDIKDEDIKLSSEGLKNNLQLAENFSQNWLEQLFKKFEIFFHNLIKLIKS